MDGKRRGRELSLLTSCLTSGVAFLAGAVYMLIPSIGSILRQELGLRQRPLITAQIATTYLAAHFWGILADRNIIQRKNIIALCSMGVGVASILIAFSNRWSLTMLLLATEQSLAAALWPTACSIIVDLTAENQRGRGLGYLKSATTLGMLASTTGTMEMSKVHVFGLPALRVAFVFIGLLAATLSLLVAAFLQEPPQQETDGLKALIEEIADIVKLYRIPTFSIIVAASVFYSIAWRFARGYMMKFVDMDDRDHDMTLELNMALYIPHAIGSLFAGYATDALSARCGRLLIRPLTAQVTISLSASIVVIIFFAIPLGQSSLTAYLILWACFGFFSAWADSGTNFPVLSEVMPGGLSRALACQFSLQSAISSFGHLFLDHLLVLPPDHSIEEANALRTVIVVTTSVGWIVCIAAYSCLNCSYPHDVHPLREKATAAPNEASEVSEGGNAGWRSTASDLPASPSESGEQTPEYSRSPSSGRPSSEAIPAHFKGWGMDGRLLHDTVDPENWCLTKQDLSFFLDAVKEEVRAGRICQHDRDRFDPTDDQVGPNMYTVVDQYLKPLTARAGAMSWALMCHPQGLKCDLFITHGWAEGVYEFIDNVLHSWPEGKHHAYICIFSNPQNLNISHMLQVPSSSPFAKALDVSSHMMVVPNHTCSIYTRAWCVYEAWLAYKANKLIFTANRKPPLSRRFLECSLLLLLPVVVGACGYYLLELLSSTKARPVAETVRLGVCGLLLAQTALSSLCQRRSVRAAATNLRKRFTVIAETDATDPLDKQRILQDIGSEAGAVDEAIEILLRNGLSTPRLRNLSGSGVVVESALDPNRFPGIGLLFFFILAGPVSLPWCLAISVFWYRGDMDQRALSLGAVNNAARLVAIVIVGVFVGMWAYDAAEHSEDLHMFDRLYFIKLLVTNVLLCIVLGIVVAGLDRVAACPMLGFPLSQILRPGAFSACCCRCLHA
mmetsp:Transcript_112458/g.328751  ORF Transcript_112458/g.328751 Transcript_112458/m.328751 type:complete len:957 (+) Transcript_112458:59-2929(+)